MSAASSIGQAGSEPSGGVEVADEEAHVGRPALADLLPHLAGFGLGRGGVAKGEEQWRHAYLDGAHGAGVDGELAGGIGFSLDCLDVVPLFGVDWVVGTGKRLLDELAQEHRFASHQLVDVSTCTPAAAAMSAMVVPR